MFKWIPRKPIEKVMVYNKFGFVKTECVQNICPRCKNVLNAGPNYQPNYCSKCGQKVDFSKTVFKEEVTLDVGRFD